MTIEDESAPRLLAPTARSQWPVHTTLRRLGRGISIAAVAFATAGVVTPLVAIADTSDSLRSGVSSVRGTACAPLRSDPAIDQAAAQINDTTDKYINNAARAIPETDALPVLKDVGYGGTKAVILSGAAATEANAVKAILLQGFADIPDCSYSDFGVSAMYNAKKDMILTTVVLAG